MYLRGTLTFDTFKLIRLTLSANLGVRLTARLNATERSYSKTTATVVLTWDIVHCAVVKISTVRLHYFQG